MSALDPLTIQGTRLTWLPDTMNWRSTWNATTQYVKNDVVVSSVDGACYVANLNSYGGLDPASTPAPSLWTQLGASGTTSGVVIENQQSNTPIVALPASGYINTGVYFTAMLDTANQPFISAFPAALANCDSVMMVVSGLISSGTSPASGFVGVADAANLGLNTAAAGHPPVPTSYPDYLNNGGISPFPVKSPLGATEFLATNYHADYMSAINSYQHTFILKQGQDFTPATTAMVVGSASTSGPYGISQSIDLLVKCEYLGLS